MYEYFIDPKTAKQKADFARSVSELDRLIIAQASKGAYNCEYTFPTNMTNEEICMLRSFLHNKGYTVKDANDTIDTIVIWWDGGSE